ncbi:2Fe-2S iron-sulfur cluster-binding protein [Brevibacillus sp. B_LB10_24]|uniref:2Fe-2S iron-sulfur cluster-binding protein n=1 Tax=Brevibacillus sp. B_LB10_24 TaxID=3380645 RepID=UPI0038BC56CB
MGKITFRPSGKQINVRAGKTLIQAARAARVYIPQRCGGHASCQMCKVVVEQGELSPPSPLELRKLTEADLAGGVRLSCQARATMGDCVVSIPVSKLKSVVAAALERQKYELEDEQ